MSDRNRKNFGNSKRTKNQGSRPNSAHVSGRNTPDPRSSSQPTVDPGFGDQSITDLSYGGQANSDQQHITGLYRSQPIPEVTSGGHPGPYYNSQPNVDPRFDYQSIPGTSYSGQATPNQQPIADPYGGQHFRVPQITPYPWFSGQATPSQQFITVLHRSQPILEATFGGHPFPYSSSQPTVDQHFGLQSTPDPSYSRQTTLNQQRINDLYPGGQHILEHTSRGQRPSFPVLGRQPTVDPFFGDQPIFDAISNEEPIPKRRRITGRYSGGQSILEPTSSGQPINKGIYIITNVKHGTLIFLPDPNHRTPLQGHFRRNIPGELWHVEELFNQRYSIQSVSHNSFASSGSCPQVKDFVEGDRLVQPWCIQKHPEGNYTIATTDGQKFWALPQEGLETPVELYGAPADPRCRWTFTELVNDACAETAIISASETLEASLNRLQGSTGIAPLGQISHPIIAKDMRDKLEKQSEDFGRATKSARYSEDFRILERLKPVDAPSYREDRGCMEGTRTALLDYLLDWSSKPSPLPNAANMYWLYGSPGLGKTSIANSLCDRLHGSKTLGGSFFCRRDDPVLREPRRILPTLISKLAEMWDPYRTLVVQALRDDPQLNPESKRGEVLFSLLQSVQTPPPHMLVLVVDALDECGDPDTRKSLLMSLLEGSSRVSWIKIIITSRPEHDIKSFFEQNHVPSRDLAADNHTLNDIRLFTRQHMSRIASSRYLPTDWPGEERLQQIINRSGGLFIFSETVCRYVDDPDPEPRLAEVLEGELVEANAELHKLYSMAILSRIGKSKEKFRSFAQAVVIVATYRPLPEETLGSLVGLDLRLVRSWVDGLSSILYRDASTNGGIRVRHLSVIDFLTGPVCPKEFRVVLGQANEEMGVCCLTTMAKDLKFNICELETSWVRNADIPDLDKRVQDKISDALQYSSMHWSSHLCSDSSPVSVAVSEQLDVFLGGMRQLYWVEVLSLMGKVPVGVSSLRLMKLYFEKFEDRHQHLVDDALRFLLAFFAPISTSTPHIYISALPFTPIESAVWKHARVSFPEMVGVCKGRDKSWPAPSSIWLGHNDEVLSVAYSRDGVNVVSGSADCTIRIWDTQTGAAVGQPLTGHDHGVSSVAYSPDGQNVVSGSADCTIRIWDAQTGAAVGQPLAGHTGAILSVAYSPDGRNVVSGSSDSTIRIWDVQTGAAVGQPLTGHASYVRSVAYSPDGRNVVSGSYDHTIRIWDAQTGAAVGQPLTGHTGWVSGVAYSPDGQNVVSGSEDNTIRIWDTQTGMDEGRHSAFGHSSYPFTNPLPLTAFSGCPIPKTWLGPDGWVRGEEGLLFWVPEDCRDGLTCPAIMTIPHTGRQRVVRIDFTRFQYGTTWTSIRGVVRGVDQSSISSV